MSDQPEEFNAPTPAPAPPRGDAESRADVPRDSDGRYVTCDEYGGPPPTYKNGNPIGRTRASTIKNGATDKTGINNWSKMTVVKGLALDPVLMSEAMKATAEDNKKALYAISERAFTKGGGKESAERGTAFHEVTERIKRGEQVTPDELDTRLVSRDVDAYLRALAENNLRPVPGMQERVVILPNGAGGTFDDLFQYWNPLTEEWELLVGDTKSGGDIWKYGALEIKVQLWQYANAKALWLGPNQGSTKPFGEPAPMPPVRKDRAVVVHSPLNGTCEVTILDLSGIGAVVDAIMVIRRARAEAMMGVHHVGKVDLREAAYVAPVQAPPEQIIPGVFTPASDGVPSEISQDGGQTWVNHGKTPQQLADEATLVARQQVLAGTLARADAMAKAEGRNDDNDDPAAAGQQIASSILDGEGKPLAPLAVPPAKGCSVCHRTGHRKGSKRCLSDRDPASEQAAPEPTGAWLPTDQEILDATEPNAFATPLPEDAVIRAASLAVVAGLPEYQVGDQVTVGGIEFTKHSDYPTAAQQLATEQGQYCPGSHPGQAQSWTTRQDMPGLSVCSIDGLPTRLHAEAMAKARAERQAAQPVDEVSAMLAGARTTTDVLAVRTTCIAKGQWSDEYEAAASARYFELQPAGWPAR